MEVDLSYNALAHSSYSLIVELLLQSSSLTSLNLCSTSLGDEGGAAILHTLLIPNFSFDDDIIPRCNSSLLTLNLSSNNLRDRSGSKLIELAKYNTVLQSLNIDSNKDIPIELMERFLMSLKSNLMCLSLNDMLLGQANEAAQSRLSTVKFKALSLNRCGMHMTSWVQLAAEQLEVSGNPGMHVASLAGALRTAENLHSLDISACGADVALIESIALGTLSSIMRILNLSYNPIGRQQAVTLAGHLSSLHSLRVLNLNGCDLKTAGAVALFAAIPTRDLQELHLQENDIHDSVCDALKAFLSVAMFLSLLDLSFNHLTLEIAQPIIESLAVTSDTPDATRILELTIVTEGNPCGANVFGAPHLCRSKRTVQFIQNNGTH
jgi:Ran GTPase-activating protein (RanGAP) involved in mRNA processing and transport